MGSYMNFKNFGETPQNQCTGSKPSVSTPLARQSSVFELTFDEFQNTLGGSGKDFGSMNMDEFLKNIWSAEETQAMATPAVVAQGSSNAPTGHLQRQGSLTLPRTLSQKTVDEVWKEMFKENSGAKDVNLPNLQQQQRQPTMGEVTLEEFLFRAGVVREEAQQMARANNNGFYNGGLSEPNNNTGLTIGFQQPPQNNLVMSNRILENSNLVSNEPSSLPLNMSGMRPSQQLPQPLFPKQATVTFTSSMPMTNNTQLASPGTKCPIVGIADHSVKNGIFQGGTLGMGALFPGSKLSGAMASPAKQLSPDGDTSSVSPPSYIVGGGGARGRKSGTLEKATERRHKRMIKNRESAARSRARKQAYTLELEAEVAKLKEMNEELRKKQDEIMEMQKNQVLETMNMPWGSKKRCLRRTLTGPW